MGRRLSVNAAVLALALGCAKGSCGPLYPCKVDSDCPHAAWYCETSVGACFDRDAGVSILSPAEGSYVGASVQVVAVAGAQGGALASPSTLDFVASPDGGAAELLTLGQIDAGLYGATWTPVAGGPYRLVATWKELAVSTAAVDVTAVLQAPVFSLQIPSPVRSAPMYQDPDLPNAWRRDEIVTAAVTSTDSLVDPATVQVVVIGIGDGGLPSRSPVAFGVTAQSCSLGYCGSAALDLARPEMKAFNGYFQATVVGRDKAGTPGGTADGGAAVPVTRWKWLYSQVGPDGGFAELDPSYVAVGQHGTVYTTIGIAPRMVAAFDLQGQIAWSWVPDAGAPMNTLAVGVSPAGTDRVYTLTFQPGVATAYALDDTHLQPAPLYSLVPVTSSPRMALGASVPSGSNSPSETLLVSIGSSLLALRPDALPLYRIWDLSTPASAVVANSKEVVVVAADGGVAQVSLGMLEQVIRGWQSGSPLGTPLALPVWSADEIVAVAPGLGTVAFQPDSGSVLWTSVSDGGTELPFAVGPDQRLTSFNASLSSAQTVSPFVGGVGPVAPFFTPATPAAEAIWGQGGFLYVYGTGTLAALDSSFTPQWTRAFPIYFAGSPYFTIYLASPSLDCSRGDAGSPLSGRPGVFYLPRKEGLYAMVVDSAGMESRSPWPMAGHDPRLTNNAATPLTAFSCP